MTNLVISEQEIRELTGYTRPTKQREVLDRMGIRYSVRRDGHIRTTRDWLAGHAVEKPNADEHFNLEALG